jgi:S1-C subfamily serine protease
MLRKLKKLVAGVACAALFCLFSLNQAELHNSYLRWEVGESVVQVLSTSGGGGTGFAIKAASGENFIVTNKHVCAAAVNGWMIIKQDESEGIFKRIVYKDSKHDLCLLQGDKRFSPLSLGSEPKKGTFNFIVGHPGLRQLTISQGEFIGNKKIQMLEEVETRRDCRGIVQELNDFQRIMYGIEFVCIRSYNTYATTAVAYPGNSGSPVVNKYGNVIGVLFAGSTQEERDNFIVPLSELVRVLNKF